MSRELFFSNLNKDQQEYCQFLIDCAYSNGYNQALIDKSYG